MKQPVADSEIFTAGQSQDVRQWSSLELKGKHGESSVGGQRGFQSIDGTWGTVDGKACSFHDGDPEAKIFSDVKH